MRCTRWFVVVAPVLFVATVHAQGTATAADTVTLTAVGTASELRLLVSRADSAAGLRFEARAVRYAGDTLTLSGPARVYVHPGVFRQALRSVPGGPELRLSVASGDGAAQTVYEGPVVMVERTRVGEPVSYNLDARGRLQSWRRR
jgi:hypothetical protein